MPISRSLGVVIGLAFILRSASSAYAASEYQCGDGGKPNRSTKRCDCPSPKVERTAGDVSQCVDAPKAAAGKKDTPSSTPKCPEGTTYEKDKGCVGKVVCPAGTFYEEAKGCVAPLAAPAVTASAAPPPTPTDDLLIDDGESGEALGPALGGRSPTWRVFASEGSALQPAPGTPFHMDSPGAGNSRYAAHLAGTVNGQPTAWAVLSVDLMASGKPVDASRYAGIEFDARSDKEHVYKFKVADINTMEGFGRCTQCNNHFSRVVPLTPAWKHFRVLFKNLHQEPGWGSPQVESLDLHNLIHIEWLASAGDIDLWVDNLRFQPVTGDSTDDQGDNPAPRMPNTAPSSGGCAGCSVAAEETTAWPAGFTSLALVAALSARRRRTLTR